MREAARWISCLPAEWFVFCLHTDVRVSADVHAIVQALCSVLLSRGQNRLTHSRSSVYLDHEMSPLA